MGVEDTYYVGQGAYGRMTEEDMLKEVRARGPINFDFNAGLEFQTYKNGILSEPVVVGSELQKNQSKARNGLAQIYTDEHCSKHSHHSQCHQAQTSTKTQEELGMQWAKLTHSTLIIGYGQEVN